MAAVVLAQLHVSCFVTAANRATPVFDVQPDRRCVRVVSKAPVPSVHGDAATSSQAPATNSASTPTPVTPTVGADPPTAEWEFHSVFASSNAATALTTHSNEFYRDITQPAARCVLEDGTNTNILATGILPTQKFRLLFGKTASTPTLGDPDLRETLEHHGQLGLLLHDFFSREDASDWCLGLSAWIVVNNSAVDLLKPPAPTEASSSSSPLSFVSIEAATFTSALHTIQTAKTHRIVMKHTAEHSHFFVRLAFFHAPSGQLSTLHLVDVMDLKDFREPVATQEKQEFYEILHDIRRQTLTPTSPKSPRSSKPPASPKQMLLSNFLQPLLTANAKTFLYANVIDSRASLRESVALLNAVANVKGFACVCRKLTGIAYTQLGFQAATAEEEATGSTVDQAAALDAAAAKAMAAVAIGESLLHRLATPVAASRPVVAVPVPSLPMLEQLPAMASPPVTSDAMTWLEAFKQRKQSILATAERPPPPPPVTHTQPVYNELPLGLDTATTGQPAPVFPLSSRTSSSSSTDLYARLMESIHRPIDTTTISYSHIPLPIEDHPSPATDQPSPLQPPPLPAAATAASIYHDLAARLNTATATRISAVEAAGLPSHVPRAPTIEGLDTATAAKIQLADTALLRQNYDALLTVVREQQQLRETAEARASDVAHDKAELETQYQVQVEQAKLELVQLKSKVRLLERQSGCEAVFTQYEDELGRLQREVHQLRSQNVELELKLVAAAEDANGYGAGGYGAGSLTELKRRYQAVCQDKSELEKQVAELRKKERHFHAQRKLIHESARKADRLARELTEKDDALVTTRLGEKRLNAEVANAQHHTQQLQQENERLLMEQAATTEELLAAKMYLASVESEQKKAAILDRFIRKHGDRLQRVRGADNNSVSIGVDGDGGWRRDAMTRDLEDKLLANIKRGLPQLVPIATKVLRKLEVQELSLREYSEREVDFINLLVELASDQPAVALRTMIEDEMKKLSLF